jgi:hypothetical protein
MFHVRNHKQLNIFAPWSHLGPNRRKLLDYSWSGLFQQKAAITMIGTVAPPRNSIR